MENESDILPYGTFWGVNKLLHGFCAWNRNLCSCTAVNLHTDLPISLSPDQTLPEYRLTRRKVEKFTHLSPGLIGAEGQETCMFLLVYCLYGSYNTVKCLRVRAVKQSSSVVSRRLFPFQNLLFSFPDILHNKFKCLLSSSNQTVRDI